MSPADRTDPGVTLTSHLHALVDAGWRVTVGPLGVLKLLGPLRAAVDAYERLLVIEAREQGVSWDRIGEALDVPRQTAHRRHVEAAR